MIKKISKDYWIEKIIGSNNAGIFKIINLSDSIDFYIMG